MSLALSEQNLNNLRSEFREYLRKEHPNWSDTTVSTVWSDAFYAYNNQIGSDFMSFFRNEAAMEEARTLIRDFLSSTKQPERAQERANDYILAMKHLKSFLDEAYPALFASQQLVPNTNRYLRKSFEEWMAKQTKPNGEPYKPNTTSAYSNALRTGTRKLNLSFIETDLFRYSTSAEFAPVYNAIRTAPNFRIVDETAGNGAYSKGLELYMLFLQEFETPSCWIFQGNPHYYDVVGAVATLDAITWAVTKYQKQIKLGDKAYIWLSGADGGIIASGTIMCDPYMKKPTADPFSREEGTAEPYLAVDIRLQTKLGDNLLPRDALLSDERTKNLAILKFPAGTNFPVTKEQQAVIEAMIQGDYRQVPVTTRPHTPSAPVVTDKRRYWTYSPGEGSYMWDEFYEKGIIGIGWDDIGDLAQYQTKETIRAAMKTLYGDENSYINAVHATWQFANEMRPGDVVYAKRGQTKIIGRGIVNSEYIFDVSRSEYRHIRKVSWTHRGEWPLDEKVATKTLTDITPYTEFRERIEDMFGVPVESAEPEYHYESYTDTHFLSDVFMSAERYEILRGLLLRKKNIILQGAPGVGKTFAAERLAFSIMGEKDIRRVKVIQFHQSYSYEDFIMGYRPDRDGFTISKGPFYDFCKQAETDERPYFFIIDEINRGNLSKIFGELLMLIENNKRGKSHAIRLLYSDEQFSVPENVHIIGMMNTADRSLAMIDYALRRRFAFFEFEPAFKTEGFSAYQTNKSNARFDALINVVVGMNVAIAEDASLGTGFRIGHSYFYTEETVDDTWLHELVEYELIPLITEYWFDEPSKVDDWSRKLRGAING